MMIIIVIIYSDILQNAPFRCQIFTNFSPQAARGHWPPPPNQNPADADDWVDLLWVSSVQFMCRERDSAVNGPCNTTESHRQPDMSRVVPRIRSLQLELGWEHYKPSVIAQQAKICAIITRLNLDGGRSSFAKLTL